VTAGERLIQQGIQQGVQQGIQQGIQQGVQQGGCKLLLRQLRKRFGPQVTPATEQRLAAASAEQLEIWAERVLSAATLDELMAD
jgi:flagellar biosynthesis/type III secretory pathway protein FliH